MAHGEQKKKNRKNERIVTHNDRKFTDLYALTARISKREPFENVCSRRIIAFFKPSFEEVAPVFAMLVVFQINTLAIVRVMPQQFLIKRIVKGVMNNMRFMRKVIVSA